VCDAANLERPRVNTWIAGFEVDFCFPTQRLIVETDSWRHHRTREAFERDRHRDAAHTRAGYRTLRFTHDQLTNRPREVVQTLAAALG
jgi:very-short-patch-repair endonuclease